jgi:hypothetical protein
VDYRLHRASQYALRLSPHGSGQGRSGSETQKSNEPKDQTAPPSKDGQTSSANGQQQSQTRDNRNEPAQNQTSPQSPSGPIRAAGGAESHRWIKILVFLAGALLVGWWLYRRRDLILQIAQAILAAVAQFFRELFQFGRRGNDLAAKREARTSRPRPFASFESPFLTGQNRSWTAEQLILYSYEALQAWAVEQGVQSRPEQTAREFCLQLGDIFPAAAAELNRLSFLYGHAAYGSALPPGCDLEPVRKLWHHFVLLRDPVGL